MVRMSFARSFWRRRDSSRRGSSPWSPPSRCVTRSAIARERTSAYVIKGAPRTPAGHNGKLEKGAMRKALRSSFVGELPLNEANAYGRGFRRLREAGVIEPASKPDFDRLAGPLGRASDPAWFSSCDSVSREPPHAPWVGYAAAMRVRPHLSARCSSGGAVRTRRPPPDRLGRKSHPR